MKHAKFSRSFEVVADLPEALEPLKTLACNFRWTWDHATYDLLRSIDKELWEESDHNPLQVLARLSPDRIKRLAKDTSFLNRLAACKTSLDEYLASETWFDVKYPKRRDDVQIAYFCAEFGISEGLPIYSGGLGLLAGDHLKAASDLGLPLVGVGLLYARGYFRQRLNADGWQQEVYPQYDFYQMPLELVRGEDEQPIRIEVEFPDRVVTCQIWKASVGRIPLYLLDSNVLENAPSDQTITDTLYGGDEEMRIRQEMILGIGGMRALKALGISPTVCHMNEGHAAFLSVERMRQFMIERHCDFQVARQVIVAGNVFTTHTPVPAGFDLFHKDLLERYMGSSVRSVGLEYPSFLQLGRMDPENEGEAFNMALLAVKNANHVNAVSELHAKVTRGMFQERWPEYPEDEVPIEGITNGVHTMSWISSIMARLFDEYIGNAWRRDASNPELWRAVLSIPDEEIWNARENLRGDFVRFARRRLQRDLERRTMGRPDFAMIGSILDPRVLTVGFARRFATYKRATLMLSERERFLNILYNPERPVQIVIAGKSHPRDDGGKRLIQDLLNFIEHGGARTRMVFLEDYDIRVARAMVQGVDLWLNNPRRPMEASGTSGMKIVPNGGINCSVLDGWWDEAYDPEVGFAIGDRDYLVDEGQQDRLDSSSLYSLLENEIAPRFYHRSENGVPREWVQMIKRSIAKLAPRFSTARMVHDYTTKFYMPASDAYVRRNSNALSVAQNALEWRSKVQKAWPQLRIVKVEDNAKTKNPLGASIIVRARIDLGPLDPADVAVEAIHGKIGPNRDLVEPELSLMDHCRADGALHEYSIEIPCERPGHQGYTVRLRPTNPDVEVPQELNLVCWQQA